MHLFETFWLLVIFYFFQDQDDDRSKEYIKRPYSKSGRKRAAAGEAWGPVAKILPPQKKAHYDLGKYVFKLKVNDNNFC